MEIKTGAGDLPAPKILFEKVLTNVSGCAKIRVQKTKGARKMKTVCDNVAAEELFLYTINNGTIYQCSIKPLIANYRKKISKNQYDREKAIKGFEHVAKVGAMHYEKEFLLKKYYIVFNAATRREAAKRILEFFEDEIWEG